MSSQRGCQRDVRPPLLLWVATSWLCSDAEASSAERAWRHTTLDEDAVSRLALQECRLAPDHGSDDQLWFRDDSGVAGMEVAAVHTVRSVANTHTSGRWVRRSRRIASLKSSACCSSICAASCRRRPPAPDSIEGYRGYEQNHLHSRTFAAAQTALSCSTAATSTPVPSSMCFCEESSMLR